MSRPSCAEVRVALRAYQAYRLTPDDEAALREHLATCAACREQDRQERALTELLETRLPRPAAPAALREQLTRRLASAAPTTSTEAPRKEASRRLTLARASALLVPVALAAAALLIVLRPDSAAPNVLARELVNDHLRVLYAERPIEIESGGIHQVKPWFAGRLDFAPRVSVEDDPEYPLVGGSVAYVVDRKAATFVFKRRLHTITLFVFRSDGLSWPRGAEHKLEHTRAEVQSMRGFNLVLFQREDLGYALVSDLNVRELSALADKLAQ